ncbi:hypothetical protein DC498_07580 [Terrimonas sp.]|uniref:hypothetical protein n=1 Tax=Terrimonas sp. TaxID=1914338 RepID=UPI000D516E70|nr:hypothetical protein [Terrimonas sp.]PVD52781.1 hypothetical protein DC498_07580 [Terrimonas sp.]
MKTKNSKLYGSIVYISMITVFIAIILISSCKKEAAKNAVIQNDMIEAAQKTGSKILSGNVAIESDDSGIVLNYNNGSKLIFIEKIRGTKTVDINRIHSAEIITSDYGVIIKNLDDKNVFFLINNDSESLKMFQSISSFFANRYQSSTVFGITVVNAEKA